MVETILVTGGAGFIGSHIVEGLVKEGYSVRVIDNLFSGKLENLASVEKKIVFYKADITNFVEIEPLFNGVDFVLHLAALRSVIESTKNPNEYNRVNVLGTVNVLEAARKNNVKRVVFTSSSSVYGNTDKLPESETDEPIPLCPYALTKLVGEQYCRMYSQLFGLETVSLRYFNVFGPRQDPKSQYACVIPIFVLALLNGKQPNIFGDGLQSRDFTFVRNIVDANIAAIKAEKKFNGDVFNIARGENITVLELFKKIRALLNSNTEPIFAAERPGEAKHTKADPKKALAVFGFECKHSFDTGLKETIDWYKENQKNL